MSASARSVFVFGIYLAVIGLALLLVPNLMLRLFLLPPTDDVWVRIVGMLSLFLAFYFVQAARREMTEFFRWTVYVRCTTIVFLVGLVFLAYASPFLLPFGLIDLIGAIWTGLTLRSAKAPG